MNKCNTIFDENSIGSVLTLQNKRLDYTGLPFAFGTTNITKLGDPG
jgi:hypothetical protein